MTWRTVAILACGAITLVMAPAFAAENTALSGADGLVELVFEPSSSRLAAAESAKLDRLAAFLGQRPEARLQLVAYDARDNALRRFLAARRTVVESELARRGIAAETISAEGSPGLERMVALKLLLPDPSPPPPSPAAVPTGQPQSLLPPSPAPVPPAEPPPPVVVAEMWTAPAGRHLKAVLQDWAGRAGWTVVWQSDHDYPLEATASFSGDFTEAARQLVAALATVAPAPYANFYKGNQVLVVHSGEGR